MYKMCSYSSHGLKIAGYIISLQGADYENRSHDVSYTFLNSR